MMEERFFLDYLRDFASLSCLAFQKGGLDKLRFCTLVHCWREKSLYFTLQFSRFSLHDFSLKSYFCTLHLRKILWCCDAYLQTTVCTALSSVLTVVHPVKPQFSYFIFVIRHAPDQRLGACGLITTCPSLAFCFVG